jgi:hypothetical protein
VSRPALAALCIGLWRALAHHDERQPAGSGARDPAGVYAVLGVSKERGLTNEGRNTAHRLWEAGTMAQRDATQR